MEKTHFKKATDKDPNYVGAHDLINSDGTYRKIIVTPTKCWFGDAKMQGSSKKAAVMEFKEVKPLILNATNKKVLAKLFKSVFIEDWHGKQIELYVEIGVRFGSEYTDAIRISPNLPKTAPNPEMLPTNKNWEALLNRYATGDIDMETIESKFTLSPTTKQLLEDAKANYRPE